MSTIADEIRAAVRGRHPLIYLCTPEEDRVMDALAGLAEEEQREIKISTWSCVTGLEPAVGDGDDTRKPGAQSDEVLLELAPRLGRRRRVAHRGPLVEKVDEFN